MCKQPNKRTELCFYSAEPTAMNGSEQPLPKPKEVFDVERLHIAIHCGMLCGTVIPGFGSEFREPFQKKTTLIYSAKMNKEGANVSDKYSKCKCLHTLLFPYHSCSFISI